MQPTNLNLKAIARDATLRGDTKTLFHALDLLERRDANRHLHGLLHRTRGTPPARGAPTAALITRWRVAPPAGSRRGILRTGEGRLAGQKAQRRWRWWWPTPSEQDQQAHLSNDVLAHWFLWSAFRRGAHKQKPRHRGAGLGGSIFVSCHTGLARSLRNTASPPPQRPAAPLVARCAEGPHEKAPPKRG